MTKQRVAKTDELADRVPVAVEVGDHEVMVVKVDGEVRAYPARCPHHGAPLAEGLVHGDRLLCPWHQAVFDLRDGELLEPPALECLPAFEVSVDDDGEVVVALPEPLPDRRQPEVATHDAAQDGRTFVIVGAGAAGLAAAQELRRAGFRGRLVMVSEDDRAPYDRTQCSKEYLDGTAPDEWMPLKPAEFFREAGVERVTNRVERVDVPSRRIVLPGGSMLEADAMLLALGAEPRVPEVPGADLDGVYLLRGWRDADAILDAAEEADSAVVMGASFIGMEVAASLRARGVPRVTVVAPEETPFATVLGATLGRRLEKLHRDNGVSFRLGRSIASFEDNGGLAAVVLDDGERLATRLAVVGVGVIPATSVVTGIELAEDGSVPTDERLRAADGVWAAGDLVRLPGPRRGDTIRIEHWRTALQQGMVAARNMLGDDLPFRKAPFFWTMQFGTPVGYVGHAPEVDGEVVHGDPDDGDAIVYLLEGDELRAAAAIGRDRQLSAFHELLLADRAPTAAEVRGSDVDLVARLVSAEPTRE